MRSSSVVCLLVVAASSVSLACGGKTPPANDEGEPATHSSAKAETPEPAASESAADAAAPPAATAETAPSAAPSAAPASASPAGGGSGASDDVWMAHHQMPPGDVLKGIRPANAKVQACYRAGVKRDASTGGEVKIRFVITHEGAVRDWKDDASTMTDEEVTKCIGELIKTLKFPKQKSPGDAFGVYTVKLGK
jgi:hypothetical protein